MSNSSPDVPAVPRGILVVGVSLGIALLVTVVFSWAMERPPVGADPNLQAYLDLLAAARTPRWSECRRYADEALARQPGDGQIQFAAGYIQQMADLAQVCGNPTKADTESLGGMAKAFLAGFQNPVLGVRGGLLLVQLPYFSSCVQTMDGHYAARASRYYQAGTWRPWIFGVMFLACLAYGYGHVLGARQAVPPPSLGGMREPTAGSSLPPQAASPKTAPGEQPGPEAGTAIVTCRHCGQKLRVPRHVGNLPVTCPACRASFAYQSP